MIRDKIQSKVAKAFNKKLADAVHPFTCTKIIYSGDFDFVTQEYSEKTETTYTGRGVLFGSYARDLVKPDDYQIEDSKATVLQNEVTAKPEIGDEWDTAEGVFRVINVGKDPTGVIWSVQLRKVGQ